MQIETAMIGRRARTRRDTLNMAVDLIDLRLAELVDLLSIPNLAEKHRARLAAEKVDQLSQRAIVLRAIERMKNETD